MIKNDIAEIKKKALPILKASKISRSFIFGSYVRGEQREDSDVDLLVEFPKGLTLFDVAEIRYKLEDALGKKVDLVDCTRIKSRLRPYILSEQVQIL